MTSNLLSASWATVPASTTPLQNHDILKGKLLDAGWQLRPDGSDAEDRVSNPTYFDVIPPATESLGNDAGYDFVRVRCYASAISVQAYMLYKVALPQSYAVYEKTAGAVTCSLTIGSTTVSYTGSSSSTAKQNLWGLYCACKASSAADFTAFDFDYNRNPPQNANDSYDYIQLVQKTPATNATITVNSNVYGLARGSYQAANTSAKLVSTDSTLAQLLTIDLASGYIYYLSISKRSFSIGTKCNSGVKAAIAAGFRNHTKALASMPTAGRAAYPLVPIELFVTTLSASYPEIGYTSHLYSLPASPRDMSAYGSKEVNGHSFRGEWCNGTIQAWTYGNGINTTETQNTLDSSVPAASASMRDEFQVYRLAVNTSKIYSTDQGTEVVPAGDVGDLWAWYGTAAEEQSLVTADPETTPATLSANIDASTGITTITGTDLSNLRSSGYVLIGREAFLYTGNDGSQLTGVTRGQFNTANKSEHFSGDSIQQARFWIKLAGGALDWGYTLPS